MPEQNNRTSEEEATLDGLEGKGPLAVLGAYMKLSGPGWLQSAITLGGGSLSSSLFLGVIAGFGMMWIQPVAMIMGVIMLSAIAYVTLATGERPFDAIRNHINPVLAWGWAIATLLANMVWAMPQFALATGAIEQNLMPETVNTDAAKWIVGIVIFILCTCIIWSYDKGGKGIKLFENILKIIVGLIVLSFVGVVWSLSSSGAIQWGTIMSGFVPNFSVLSSPAESYNPYLEALTPESQIYWSDYIVAEQRKIITSSIAFAVGINMTFLLPYSMLKKGWNEKFRSLAIFDLSTGLFIPYIIATACVVIAAAAQFHPNPNFNDQGFENSITVINQSATLSEEAGKELLVKEKVSEKLAKGYLENLSAFKKELKIENATLADQKIAALLVKRDTGDLATSLSPFLGETVAQKVFGFGVLAMAVSTALILMLINGFVVCEMLGFKDNAKWHRIGCVAAGVSGLLGARLLWGTGNAAWLSIPTSAVGMILLPIAYITFLCMMNSKSLLGDKMPRGGNRVVWNSLMITATAFASYAALATIMGQTQQLTDNIKRRDVGFAMLGVFVLLAIIVHFACPRKTKA